VKVDAGLIEQLRAGYAAKGHEPITPVIAIERQPSDSSWPELCEHEGILLLWPDVAEKHIKDAFVAEENKRNLPSQ
jgi:hypothetical protein